MLKLNPYKLLLIFAVTGTIVALVVVGLVLTVGDETRYRASVLESPDAVSIPDFTLELLDGSTFQLNAHQGSPILINFFASWCMPCKEEMPVIEEIRAEYEAKGVIFLGIAVDDSEDQLMKFIEDVKLRLAAGIDKTGEIKDAFGLYGVPTTYFINKDGEASYIHAGMVTKELMRYELDKLL